MPIVDLNTLEIGQTILFKSINTYDPVLRKGLITGFVDYNVARMFKDILPYYSSVKKTHPELPPIETLNYIMFKLYENDILNNQFVFAKEWLEPSSVRILVLNKSLKITVYDQDETNAEDIMNILRSNGYIVSYEK